jgi:TolB-like protein
MVLGAVALRGEIAAQQPRTMIAVLPFENSGSYGQDQEAFAALQVGLATMLSSALGRHPRVEVAQTGRLTEAMTAAGLVPGQRVDAATAAQVAKGIGARYAVAGGFADFYGRLRVTARLVDAETVQILKVVSNDDPELQDRAQLSAIVQRLSEKITEAVGLPPISSSGGASAIPAGVQRLDGGQAPPRSRAVPAAPER